MIRIRTFLFLFLVLISGFAACTDVERTNIVVILVDDLGWAELGCYGSRFYETPSLDQLAATGFRFTDAYAASPVCSPTRASIMAGKHPARVRITDWIPGRDPKDRMLLGPQDRDHLPLSEVTLAERFRSEGYRTFFAGKWHLGGEGYYPEDQGFEFNLGGHEKGSPPGGYYTPYENPKLSDGPEGEYLTDRLTDESIAFLEKHHEEPFFLYLSFYTVHTPIQACKRHLPKFEAKAEGLDLEEPMFLEEHLGMTRQVQSDPEFASMVHAMDENVGRLLNRIEALGLSEETVVVFTSDNGGLSTLAQPRAPTSNLPLRAGKGWCYEGGIRVPLIIRLPGTEGGSEISEPVITTDLYPTLLDIAGLSATSNGPIDGLSLTPLLNGEEGLAERDLYWHFPHYHGSTWTPGAAIRSGDWKLIEFYHWDKVELYNLAEDLAEQNDLSEIHTEKRDELLAKLHAWQQEVDAQMPEPNPSFEPSEEASLTPP